jgi:NAD(P)H-dependent flavin oxidoreductase YrpB (nitropropane dioxygenase family)
MRTKATEMFGNELPIFAFSHCRDVVTAVSRAGGVGVLGCAYMTAQQLRQELSWIDDHVEGKPYGVDLLMPGNYQETSQPRLTLADLPELQSEYMRKYCDDHGLPPLPEAERDEMVQAELDKLHLTPEQAAELIDIALEHPIKLVVNALGAPPKEMVEKLHRRGIKVGSLIGKLDHVARQLDVGVDILIAQGHEAGGHTGDIASLVLWPQIVDAVAPVPVLAAGGVGRARYG